MDALADSDVIQRAVKVFGGIKIRAAGSTNEGLR